MILLFIRHGIAEDRDPEIWPDDHQRPLTAKGIRRFRRVARCLRELCPEVEAVWSSPLVRAWQTAEILEEEAEWPAPEQLDALKPGASPEALLSFLSRRSSIDRGVLVGHEPGLSEAISFFLSGPEATVTVEMKKGGVASLRFGKSLRAGAGKLCWVATPRVLG